MKAWATAKNIKRDVADVTDKYLDLFGVFMPEHTRKYGDGVTGTLVFNTAKLLECIEKEVRFPTPDNPVGYGPHVPPRRELAGFDALVAEGAAEAARFDKP